MAAGLPFCHLAVSFLLQGTSHRRSPLLIRNEVASRDETVEHDRKSDMPVILYAEFTAKPGSESEVQMLISGLAERVRQEPGNAEFTVYRERDNPRKFFVFEHYLDEASFEAHIADEFGVTFNQQLSSLIEEGASQLTFLTRVDPP
jgi:quinol monooxygenase YgiN